MRMRTIDAATLARLINETETLVSNKNKLETFTNTDKFKTLALVDQSDLIEQLEYMTKYAEVLNRRVSRLEN